MSYRPKDRLIPGVMIGSGCMMVLMTLMLVVSNSPRNPFANMLSTGTCTAMQKYPWSTLTGSMHTGTSTSPLDDINPKREMNKTVLLFLCCGCICVAMGVKQCMGR